MKKVQIIALRQDRKRLLEHLQNSGILQIVNDKKSDNSFEKLDLTSQVQIFERNVNLTEQALRILDENSSEKKGLFSSFSGRREINPDEIGEIASNAGKIINICNKINELSKTIAENESEQIRINTSIAQLEMWSKLDIPLNTTDTKSTAIFIGTIAQEYTQESLSKLIAEQNPKLEFELEIQATLDNTTCLVLFTPISQKLMAEDVLRNIGFSKPINTTSRIPTEKINRLRDKSKKLDSTTKQSKEEIISYADKRSEIRETQDYFRIRADKYNVINSLNHTKHTFVITGYIPNEDCQKLETLCNRIAICHIDFDDADETAPIKLRNNAFSRPAQGIVSMYATPSHEDIDPTPVLAFFFYFFFGMMFSDAGYGLLLVLGTWFAIKLFKPDTLMYNNLKLFQYCGISTFLWGIVFGSFFGDAPAVLYNHFAGTNLTMADILPYRFIDPQKDALMLMIISIAFGLVHILVGMGCKFYVCIKQNKYSEAFLDTGLWMLLLIGIAILSAGLITTKSVIYIGVGIAIACAIGLILTQGRHKKGFGKITGGFASLYDITSYISDLLSYTRLLALGLTTGVMAQVFNMLAVMLGNNALGIVFMIVILIFGHAINIGLNALGSYVHTMRLQYVEMFSKFYDGGGKEFEPFSLDSKYIKIQEEKSK